MLRKGNQSAKLEIAGLFCIFLILLLCNVLTPFLVDDFNYLYSFKTRERIADVADIIPSMLAHASTMNGRLFAHGLVQLFGMLPNSFFDVINAVMFTLQIFLIGKVSRIGGSRNNLLTAAIFCAIWMYEPAFGQINLWQDGAVNYLWSVIFGLLFLLPFLNAFMLNGAAKGRAGKWLSFVTAFVAGAYSETVSAAVIFMAVLLVVLNRLYSQKKIQPYLICLIITAVAGYLSIYAAPAQWANKSVRMSVDDLLGSIINAIGRYESMGSLIAAFVVLLVFNVSDKTDTKRILLAFVFLAGSLVANFIMVFASYYPERSVVGACVLLICADAILAQPVLESKRYQTFMVSVLALLILSAVPELEAGIWDISSTYRDLKANEEQIYECRETGEMNIELPMVVAKTKYSAVYDAKYLDTENSGSWPNNSMAKYYEVDSIIGVWKTVDDE